MGFEEGSNGNLLHRNRILVSDKNRLWMHSFQQRYDAAVFCDGFSDLSVPEGRSYDGHDPSC